jgi:hypothetical protein
MKPSFLTLLRRPIIRMAPRYGPHYGVAAQGVLRGMGFLYVLSFWSVAAQIPALSGDGGLLPARAFYEFLLQQVGDHAPWIYPGLGWISLSPSWMLAVCGLGVLAGLGLLYGFLPWVSGGMAWVCWMSMVQMGQPWISGQGDLLLAEMGFYVLFLVPVRSLFYPKVEAMASRLTGILLLNLLVVRVFFLSGMAKLSLESGMWADSTALFHFFETQPLPTLGAWLLHQLPGIVLTYLLWGWMFLELMLPWYTFLPRVFRNIFAGGIVLKSVVLLVSGHHGIAPILYLLLAFALVDDVSWRRLLPLSWGPSASTRMYRPGWLGTGFLIAMVPLLLLQTLLGSPDAVPRPWQWIQQGLGHVHTGWSPPSGSVVPVKRIEVSLQGSANGQQWVEYPFWMKPSNPAVLPALGLPHIPRLDLAFESVARSLQMEEQRVPVWLLQLIAGLLQGNPGLEALFPANPFPEQPPSYLRLVIYELTFADPVTKRENGVWWERKPVGLLGPIFSLQSLGSRSPSGRGGTPPLRYPSGSEGPGDGSAERTD